MRHVDLLLGRWVEWLKAGGGVSSLIGYPPSTTEYRILRNGPGGKTVASSKVPVWFWGVEESRIHRAILRLPDHERTAILLEWLWTSQRRGKHVLPVTLDQRRRRFARETDRAASTYHRILRRAEHSLVHDLLYL